MLSKSKSNAQSEAEKKIFCMRVFTSVLSGVVLTMVYVKELPHWLYLYVTMNILMGWDMDLASTVVYFSFGSFCLLISRFLYSFFGSFFHLFSGKRKLGKKKV